MIAYLILMHRYPNQFKRLFRAIYKKDNFYLIHVDKNSGNELLMEVEEFLEEFPNTKVLKSQTTNWGGYSLVDAELRGIRELLKLGLDWKFFINLSAQDFPLKSQDYIQNFLSENLDRDFIKVLDQKKMRPDTMSRIENYINESDLEDMPIVKRDFLTGVTPYIGNQWMILSRKFCEFLSNSPEVDRYRDFYKNTFIADEGFFQTVIMNTSYKSTIINDAQRAIDWIPQGTIKLRPRDFTSKDIDYLKNSHNLFARKFDENIDVDIFTLIENELNYKNLE